MDKVGVGSVDGVNPTDIKPGTLENGRRYLVEARVTVNDSDAEIEVRLDGMLYLHWRGAQQSLSMYVGWDALGAVGVNVLGLTAGEVEVVFHRVELEMLDGEAMLLRPPPASPPPGVRAVPAGEPVNLLTRLDAGWDAFDVSPRTTDAGVELSSDQHGRVSLPVWPRGSYELSGSFTIAAAGSPVLLIPTLRTQGAINWFHPLDGSLGLSLLEGRSGNSSENPTHIGPGRVHVDRQHTFHVKVVCENDMVDVAVELDGEPGFGWKGPESAISLYPAWDLPNPRVVGIGVQKGTVVYHELTLKMLDGEAWLLRSGE